MVSVNTTSSLPVPSLVSGKFLSKYSDGFPPFSLNEGAQEARTLASPILLNSKGQNSGHAPGGWSILPQPSPSLREETLLQIQNARRHLYCPQQ